MTLQSCPVCHARHNGARMKQHLRTCHPKYSPSARSASRSLRTGAATAAAAATVAAAAEAAATAAAAAAACPEEWVACGVCGHAARTRGELIRHAETEHLRADSPRNLRMILANSEEVRAIKVELKRTSSDCGWMEHMYVDKTINRCKGTVGKPYMQQVGSTKVRVTKLCPASILIEPMKSQFHLTFYNQHMGHDCFTYHPTPFAAPFIVTKHRVYEKMLKIFDLIKKHALDLSDSAMNVLLKRAEEMEEYMNSMMEPELLPIEEVMISSDMDPLETPSRKRKMPIIKTPKDLVEKAVDAALEKYIKTTSPIIPIKPLEETQKTPMNTSTPILKVTVPKIETGKPKIETAKPKIVNSFSLNDEEDIESFVKDVELLVNNGKSYETTERRSKLGKGGESLKKDASESKVKTYGRKSLPNIETSKLDNKLKEVTIKKVNANGKKILSQSMLNVKLSDSEDEAADTKKVSFQRMATRRQSVNLPKDNTKPLNKRRLSMNVDKYLSSNQSLPINKTQDTKKASPFSRIATRNNSVSPSTVSMNADKNLSSSLTKSQDTKKASPFGRIATRNNSVSPMTEKTKPVNRLSTSSNTEDTKAVEGKKALTNAKTAMSQTLMDAKKKADAEGLANETIKLGSDLVKVNKKVHTNAKTAMGQSLTDPKKKATEAEDSANETVKHGNDLLVVKKVPTVAKTVMSQSLTDAKNKATEVEGNRLANETIKLGNDLVKVKDIVDGIASPKKKIVDFFPTSSFNDSYKHFITKEFHVPAVTKAAKKPLSLEVSAEGINQSDRQVPEDLKDLVKMKRSRQSGVKDDIFTELLGGVDASESPANTQANKKPRLSKSDKVTNDMLIELLSEPNVVPSEAHAEVIHAGKKVRSPKGVAQTDVHAYLGGDRIVLTDKTKNLNTDADSEPKMPAKRVNILSDRIVMTDKTVKRNTDAVGEAKKLTKRISNAGKITKSGLKSKQPISKPTLKMAAAKSLSLRLKNPPKSRVRADQSMGRLDATESDSDAADSPKKSVRGRKAAPVAKKVVEEKFIVKEREDDCNILIIRM